MVLKDKCSSYGFFTSLSATNKNEYPVAEEIQIKDLWVWMSYKFVIRSSVKERNKTTTFISYNSSISL